MKTRICYVRLQVYLDWKFGRLPFELNNAPGYNNKNFGRIYGVKFILMTRMGLPPSVASWRWDFPPRIRRLYGT